MQVAERIGGDLDDLRRHEIARRGEVAAGQRRRQQPILPRRARLGENAGTGGSRRRQPAQPCGLIRQPAVRASRTGLHEERGAPASLEAKDRGPGAADHLPCPGIASQVRPPGHRDVERRSAVRHLSAGATGAGGSLERPAPVPAIGNWREKLVGVRGFEPPAPASRTQCSTRLSYTPTAGLYSAKARWPQGILPLRFRFATLASSRRRPGSMLPAPRCGEMNPGLRRRPSPG